MTSKFTFKLRNLATVLKFLFRFDGRTMAERLQGLWPKHEDWHGIRIAYEVKAWCLAIHFVKLIYLFNLGITNRRTVNE